MQAKFELTLLHCLLYFWGDPHVLHMKQQFLFTFMIFINVTCISMLKNNKELVPTS